MSKDRGRAASKPTRRERALETRRRIVAAAYRVFCAHGFQAATMEAIAAEADVAVQTLYFTFHTKIALLYEAFDAAVLGFDTPTPPDQSAWFAALVAEPDARVALRALVDNASEIFRRVAPLASVFGALGALPEAIARYRQREQLRRDSFRRVTRMLAGKRPLRGGVSAARAADVLFVLLGPETYHAMTHGCGWSHAEWKRWAEETLCQQLFDEA